MPEKPCTLWLIRSLSGSSVHYSAVQPAVVTCCITECFRATQVQVKFKFGDPEDLKIFQSVQLLSSSYNSIMILNCLSCACFFLIQKKKTTKSTKQLEFARYFCHILRSAFIEPTMEGENDIGGFVATEQCPRGKLYISCYSHWCSLTYKPQTVMESTLTHTNVHVGRVCVLFIAH